MIVHSSVIKRFVMKNFNHILASIIIFCVSLFLLSCKKQIAEPIAAQSELSSESNNPSQCTPTTIGVYSVYPSNPATGEWTTLAQKWYENGKVKFLKAKHGSFATPILDPILDYLFNLEWAEVSYQGNQVYLIDVPNNRTIMRVTLDNQGRPVASYYNYSPIGSSEFTHDTTYYYYNGDRLDYLISLYVTTVDSYTPYAGFRKYVFSYDSWGNLVKAEFPGAHSLNIEYDYTKPVSGIINNFHLTSPLKLLEYMELIQLPMHHTITKTDFGMYSGYPPPGYFTEITHLSYKDYVITDGLVRSYVNDDPYRIVTIYNGWDCTAASSTSTANKSGNAISSLKEFQQLYRR